jgi:hypothetical protein
MKQRGRIPGREEDFRKERASLLQSMDVFQAFSTRLISAHPETIFGH